MKKTDDPTSTIDWSLTTWDGTRREQSKRWAELPLERIILALQEMQELAEAMATPVQPGSQEKWASFARRMRPVDSTAIARAGYDEEKRILRLEYKNGRTYDYFAVPPQIYKELLSSGSAGEFVNLEIKPHYDCVDVE